MYYLWSTKAGGWMTHSGTYSSDRGNARKFERSEAIETAKAHSGRLIPVAKQDLDEVFA